MTRIDLLTTGDVDDLIFQGDTWDHSEREEEHSREATLMKRGLFLRKNGKTDRKTVDFPKKIWYAYSRKTFDCRALCGPAAGGERI